MAHFGSWPEISAKACRARSYWNECSRATAPLKLLSTAFEQEVEKWTEPISWPVSACWCCSSLQAWDTKKEKMANRIAGSLISPPLAGHPVRAILAQSAQKTTRSTGCPPNPSLEVQPFLKKLSAAKPCLVRKTWPSFDAYGLVWSRTPMRFVRHLVYVAI